MAGVRPMTFGDRTRLVDDLAAFLAGRSSRPRAVVLLGQPGMGASTMLDLVQAEALSRGCLAMVVVDDVDAIDDTAIDALRARVGQEGELTLLVAGRDLPAALADLLDRSFDRRVVELQPLDDDAARDLVGQFGLAPWGFQAAQMVRAAAGVPRDLVDAAFDPLDLAALPARSRVAPTAITARLEHSLGDRAVEWNRTRAGAQRTIDSVARAGDLDLADSRSDAHAALAEQAFANLDLEVAIRHGEQAAATDGGAGFASRWGAALASAARAYRGEPTALLSLHALAGAAARGGHAVLESGIWWLISVCTCSAGDVAASRRAAIRAIERADAGESLAHGVRARMTMAELLVAGGEHVEALAYLRELQSVAEHAHYRRVEVDALTLQARALMAAGDVAAAQGVADRALERAMRNDVPRSVQLDVCIVVARAHVANGSLGTALAALGTPDRVIADAEHRGHDFWMALEAVRMLARAGNDPALLGRWLEALATFQGDDFGGALRAAHVEADAWRLAADGRRAEAARLATRARELWRDAAYADEMAVTEPLVRDIPDEHGPRFSLVGDATPVAPADDPNSFEALTRREREIARYVAAGLTNPEIAGELHLSTRTVEHHVASILRKLELPSRRALMRGRR
ncbi:MAG: ATPase-like protein [Thermoleophilia bacterium]|jgi:DNA-binding NarL/FixJ family response regulator|nr:ATPase-like protein [Thermoleophilia bacterium]